MEQQIPNPPFGQDTNPAYGQKRQTLREKFFPLLEKSRRQTATLEEVVKMLNENPVIQQFDELLHGLN